MKPPCLAGPQLDPAQKAIDVANNFDVRGQFRADELSVSTSDEEPIASPLPPGGDSTSPRPSV
jgi:hypothetical protein